MQAITHKTDDPAGLFCDFPFSFRPYRTPHTLRGGIILTLLFLVALLAQPLSAYGATSYSPTTYELYLAPTGQVIQGAFLQAFQKYGLELIGYPLTSEMNEGGRTVQYFERVKMEYHPELAAQGLPVLFTRLGADISTGSAFGTVKSFSSTSSDAYFPQTGHSLSGAFLNFWNNNGGLSFFGYPISEVIWQDGMQVQWFERARMEYHPDLAAQGFGVQLTLLGTLAYKRSHRQPTPLSNPSLVNLSSMEASLLAGINAQRAAAGISSLTITPALADFAHWRSSDMASRSYFSHVTPDGRTSLQMLGDRGISYSYAGEILAKNNNDDADSVGTAISTFMQSPEHRSIMLDSRFTQIGVGYAKGSDGMNYFTAVFIRN